MKRNVHIVVFLKHPPLFFNVSNLFHPWMVDNQRATSAADPHHWMDLDPNPTNAAPVSRHLTRSRGGLCRVPSS